MIKRGLINIQRWTIIGKNLILKISENFSEIQKKIRLKIPFRCREFIKHRKYFTQLWRNDSYDRYDHV